MRFPRWFQFVWRMHIRAGDRVRSGGVAGGSGSKKGSETTMWGSAPVRFTAVERTVVLQAPRCRASSWGAACGTSSRLKHCLARRGSDCFAKAAALWGDFGIFPPVSSRVCARPPVRVWVAPLCERAKSRVPVTAVDRLPVDTAGAAGDRPPSPSPPLRW